MGLLGKLPVLGWNMVLAGDLAVHSRNKEKIGLRKREREREGERNT